MFRIGFGAQYTVSIIRNPQNSIGTYVGPYMTLEIVRSFTQGISIMRDP